LFDGIEAVHRIRLNYDLVGALVSLMFLDIVSGVLLAVLMKKVSSPVCRKGMSVKAGIFLLICVAAIIEPYANGLPAVQVCAIFYIGSESISILEKLQRIGVPIPKVFVESLVEMKDRMNVFTRGKKDETADE